MTVYVVLVDWCYDGSEISQIFKNRVDAEQWAAKLNDSGADYTRIEEWEINENFK